MIFNLENGVIATMQLVKCLLMCNIPLDYGLGHWLFTYHLTATNVQKLNSFLDRWYTLTFFCLNTEL